MAERNPKQPVSFEHVATLGDAILVAPEGYVLRAFNPDEGRVRYVALPYTGEWADGYEGKLATDAGARGVSLVYSSYRKQWGFTEPSVANERDHEALLELERAYGKVTDEKVSPTVVPDWDPAEHERKWYYHAVEGDRGYLVRRGGADMVRYDRPGDEILRKLSQDWIPCDDLRLLNRMQTAKIAFTADTALCGGLNLHVESRREWLSMRDADRIDFMKHGPADDRYPVRNQMFAKIMGVLDAYTEKS